VKPLRYERGILLRALAAGAAGTALALLLLWTGNFSDRLRWTATILLVLMWVGFAFSVESHVVFPLRTLANLLSALREGDFSIRASGARRNDALGEVLREVNDLGGTLREQRLGAVEAATLLRKVMDGIDVAVFGFDDRGILRLVNRAGEQLLAQPARFLLNSPAERLGLSDCLTREDRRIVSMAFSGRSGRWEIRKTRFRESGLPHELLFVSDLSQTLREEERRVWQRLIRVLGHELNNSLAPIKSVAESMAGLLGRRDKPSDWQEDMRSSLAIIASRADALARFMGSYARLARLPAPSKHPLDVGQWIRHVAALEQRTGVIVTAGSELSIFADADQLDQLLINLVRNAVDASLETGGQVEVGWQRADSGVEVWVRDEGPGLANPANVFVPFFTTKPGGTGIGLVLCRQIAEAHGGTLTLENRVSAPGCEARLRLPI
jgi:two-component system nitrogen regulation sensor histidine kinase NtrY